MKTDWPSEWIAISVLEKTEHPQPGDAAKVDPARADPAGGTVWTRRQDLPTRNGQHLRSGERGGPARRNGGNYQNWDDSADLLTGTMNFPDAQTGRFLDSNYNGNVYTLPQNFGNYQNWYLR